MNTAIYTVFGRNKMSALLLTDQNFTKEVKLSEKPVVLVEFYGQWNEDSLSTLPFLDEISDELDYVKVCKMDADESPKITARYGVLSAPTFIVFHNAQIVNMQIGKLTKDDIKNMVI